MKKNKENEFGFFELVGAIAGMVIVHLMYPWIPNDGFDLVMKILGLIIFGGVIGGIVGRGAKNLIKDVSN
jgi:hypothetical protein